MIVTLFNLRVCYITIIPANIFSLKFIFRYHLGPHAELQRLGRYCHLVIFRLTTTCCADWAHLERPDHNEKGNY